MKNVIPCFQNLIRFSILNQTGFAAPLECDGLVFHQVYLSPIPIHPPPLRMHGYQYFPRKRLHCEYIWVMALAASWQTVPNLCI
jgi:hypothetical protein